MLEFVLQKLTLCKIRNWELSENYNNKNRNNRQNYIEFLRILPFVVIFNVFYIINLEFESVYAFSLFSNVIIGFYYLIGSFDPVSISNELLQTTFVFVSFIDRKTFQLINENDWQLFNNIYNHFGIFRITNNRLDITSLTSIKKPVETGYNVFPFKSSMFNPPLKTRNGLFSQGLCGISRDIGWKSEYEIFFEKYASDRNPSKFLDLSKNDLAFLDNIIETKNIIIREKTLLSLTVSEQKVLFLLSRIKKPLLTNDFKLAWSLFEPQKFSQKQRFEMLLRSQLIFKDLGNFDEIVIAQQKVIEEFCINSNQTCSGCLGYPFVPFQHQDLDD